jgi:hypothetical protein
MNIEKFVVNKAAFKRTLLIALPLERTLSFLIQHQISHQTFDLFAQQMQ